MKNNIAMNSSYLQFYSEFLNSKVSDFVTKFLDITENVSDERRYFFAGNGASAAIASHLSNDFSKALTVKAQTFHDPALITCFGNDYGYESWLLEAVKLYGSPKDVLVLISSSGRSPNIVNAAKEAKLKGMVVVSLTGPEPSDALLHNTDVHLSVQSRIYNIIECCHMIALCAIVDSKNLVEL